MIVAAAAAGVQRLHCTRGAPKTRCTAPALHAAPALGAAPRPVQGPAASAALGGGSSRDGGGYSSRGGGGSGGGGGGGPEFRTGESQTPDRPLAVSLHMKELMCPMPFIPLGQLSFCSRSGDWNCRDCGGHNFASRTECVRLRSFFCWMHGFSLICPTLPTNILAC